MKITAVEFLSSHDVLKRHAADPVTEAVFKRLGFLFGESAVIVRIEILALNRQRMSKQELRCQPRVRNMMQFEPLGSGTKRLPDDHATSSFLRRSAWK